MNKKDVYGKVAKWVGILLLGLVHTKCSNTYSLKTLPNGSGVNSKTYSDQAIQSVSPGVEDSGSIGIPNSSSSNPSSSNPASSNPAASDGTSGQLDQAQSSDPQGGSPSNSSSSNSTSTPTSTPESPPTSSSSSSTIAGSSGNGVQDSLSETLESHHANHGLDVNNVPSNNMPKKDESLYTVPGGNLKPEFEKYRCGSETSNVEKSQPHVWICHVEKLPGTLVAHSHSLCIALSGAVRGHDVAFEENEVGGHRGDYAGKCEISQ